MLNPQSPIPLYHQLADILREKISSGEYPPGSKIPSEPRLAEAYGIGRPTARQAVDLLVRKRLVTRKRGSGTYVEATDKEVDLFSLGGTLSAFHKKGLSICVEIVDPIVLKVVDNDPENPFFGQSAYYLSRLSIVDDAPVLIEDLYLHAKLFEGIDRYELSGRSISRIAEQQYHLRPTCGKQNYRIGYLKNIKGKRLGVSPVTPILVVKRFLHFPVAENAVFSKLYCCTDRFVFSQNIGDVAYE